LRASFIAAAKDTAPGGATSGARLGKISRPAGGKRDAARFNPGELVEALATAILA
jgi:hypothetical protein